ncbi:oligosaccharyltransferase subunit 5 kud isoform X1 [Rhipicephalus microplus]|uniref:Dolichyl-diphosphooligosaccharide-protein glycosyltransferase subunit TMEM258 n=1 Tax=Rhipicephalus microplus TaxID=6941 RepID=A0A6M2CJR6_RHIMP
MGVDNPECSFVEKLGIEHMYKYVSPVNPAVYPHLTLVLMGIGLFFMAWFFVYEVTSTKFTRDLFKELIISLVAAVFLGFGILFLLLWVGIYV